MGSWFCVLVIMLLCFAATSICVEFTFELPDKATQCFFQDIEKDVEVDFEFQVITGGQYDVDVQMFSPIEAVMFNAVRKQFDRFNWKTNTTGTFKACFSNEFSTFSHKVVYMNWKVGKNEDVSVDHAKLMSFIQISSSNMHERFKMLLERQTHIRLNAASGLKFAEDLNERVTWWSVCQTVIMVIIAVVQVMILKSFFSDRERVRF
ncbi:Transmembrane emp24 domain-containing protein 7 [Trichinella britovi]|uniref:Transmembrane emp24 domain-containing protein 7 n=1 Tax=Trichinella britovi TaxID=45882 RepID=A0A0V1D998_TRIBR|nr:Transmembrane emp24 domain-containing protein 7 [Trichinella britovi]